MIFRWDPCGIVCVLLIYVCIAYADYVVIYWLVLPTFDESLFGVLHVTIFNMCIFVMCLAHTRAMTADPGIVPRSQTRMDFGDLPTAQRSQDSDSDAPGRDRGRTDAGANTNVGDNWTVCGRCEAYRPPRAHHCRVCQRCIRKMDHHCPWINNCVGEYNQKYFLQFLFFVGVTSLYAIGLVVAGWAYPCTESWCKNERMHHTKVFKRFSRTRPPSNKYNDADRIDLRKHDAH